MEETKRESSEGTRSEVLVSKHPEMGVNQAETSSGGEGGSVSKGTDLEPRNYDVPADVAGHASSLPLPAISSFAAGAFSDPNLKKASRICGFAGTTGGDFTPHVIHVQVNEDVLSTIISFFEQSPRTVYMLSATGVISSVVIRQPHSSDRFLRYEGYFEIVSLKGLLVIRDEGGIDRNMLSILLANPDATVFGGGVEGALIARWPIQMVTRVGLQRRLRSWNHQYTEEHRRCKPKNEPSTSANCRNECRTKEFLVDINTGLPQFGSKITFIGAK